MKTPQIIQKAGEYIKSLTPCKAAQPVKVDKLQQSKRIMKAGRKTINKALLVPGIVIDIDGVVTKGDLPIGNTPNVIKALLKASDKVNFCFLTNDGGHSEKSKTDKVNSNLGFVAPPAEE